LHGNGSYNLNMAIPHTFVQELLARADVVDTIGRHVQLKKSGANFMGLCPFHSEKSPSFSVSPSKQFYHCFGCGKSGDAINFLMEHTGASFIEAVQDLAQQFGMPVPEDDASPQDRERAAQQRKKQATLTDVLEQAARGYQKQLKASERAANYFKGRGVSGQVAKQFGLGYAPDGWHGLSSVFPDYNDPLLEESGLVIVSDGQDGPARRYDRFRDRVMFPIRNVKGECIGFGGRVLGDDKPKYLNSPETPVFSKGRELYGLFEARNAIRDVGYALVTEGYMDVVALAQLGFPNAVATLGTACTPDHVQKLFRFTDAIIFSFDGDSAGRRAAHKALNATLPLATDLRNIKFLFLPPEHDPDSFIREHGKEAFARFISDALPLSQFLIDAARDGCDLLVAEGRARLASHAKPLWEAMPPGALKQQLLSEIAELVQLPQRELLDIWQHSTVRGNRKGIATIDGERLETSVWDRSRPHRKVAQSRQTGARLPAARADHAARMLLSNMGTFDSLTGEDLALLTALPAPHGPLFVWLQAQVHEHGAQPWAALRAGLQGHPSQPFALDLMSVDELTNVNHELSDPNRHEARQELRQLLNRMLIDRLKTDETAALEEAKTNPAALVRYRDLQVRRRLLVSSGSNSQAGATS